MLCSRPYASGPLRPGCFSSFALARELDSRGHLAQIYTTYPWVRVKREQLARRRVRTFPWIHPAALALKRRLRLSSAVLDRLDTVNAATFDRYVSATLPNCNVFIGMSGSALRSGLRAQERGATYICDRGSSHVRYQVKVLAEEYARWGCAADHMPAAAIRREEAEYEAADVILVPSEFSFRSFVEMAFQQRSCARWFWPRMSNVSIRSQSPIATNFAFCTSDRYRFARAFRICWMPF